MVVTVTWGRGSKNPEILPTSFKYGLIHGKFSIIIYNLTNQQRNRHREKFGVHDVDMEDSARKRTPKGTAAFLKKIFEDNGFVQD